MSIIYLALGTNLGDRPANLRAAIETLPSEINVITESKVYETPPWGYEINQPSSIWQLSVKQISSRSRF